MKDHKEALQKALREKGLKITPQRLAILGVLVENTSLHPSAGFIYQAAKKMKGLSLSTVYYTLNELSRHGIIKTLEFDRMENRYEATTSNHLNLVCIGCGSIEDFNKPLPVLPGEVEKRSGFRPYEVRFEYHGYCKKCLKKRR
jgi:Fe2+ or Zn2+ uptake regulation protein